MSWPLGRPLCSEHVAEPPRETLSGSSCGEGPHTYAWCITMVLVESRKITDGGWFPLPGGRNRGSHGHRSVSTPASSRAEGRRGPHPMVHRRRALKCRLEARVLGMVFLWGRALMRSVLYIKKKTRDIGERTGEGLGEMGGPKGGPGGGRGTGGVGRGGCVLLARGPSPPPPHPSFHASPSRDRNPGGFCSSLPSVRGPPPTTSPSAPLPAFFL